MKILITGATGFIGSHLAKALAKNNKISALVRKNSDINELKKLKTGIAYGNLNDVNSLCRAVKGNDVVIHCAALHGNYSYRQIYEANIIGTENLLKACEKSSVKKFIYFSSATTFGRIEGGNEKSKRSPETDYAKTKLLGEKIAGDYMKKKLSVTILIPPLVYGCHKRASMIKWFRYIKKGYFLIFGNGKNKIEVVYIDDLVDAALRAVKSKKAANQKYIISGQTTTMNDFTSEIAMTLKVRKPRHIPKSIAYALGFFLGIIQMITGKDMPINATKVRNMSRSRSLDMSKAREELGYRPKTGIKEGIRKVIYWMGKEGLFK